jgi:hypothetical protein
MRKKFEDLTKKVYEEFKPEVVYLLSRIADMFTTYLNLKNNPFAYEANFIMREIFEMFGVDGGCILNIGFSSAFIPLIYSYQKIAEKTYKKMIKEELPKYIKNLHNIFLYSLSSSSIYASINNILAYLKVSIPENYSFLASFLALSAPLVIYSYKSYRDLKK